MNVIDIYGRRLDAEATLGSLEHMHGIHLESRGGKKGTESARNPDYFPALKTIVARLCSHGISRANVYVCSTKLKNSPLEDREIRTCEDGVDLMDGSPEEVRKRICREQTTVGQKPGAKGGNPHKRIFITADIPADEWMGIVVGHLGEPPHVDVSREISLEDARTKTLRSVNERKGQPRFRRMLLEAYGGRCAVTGCDIPEILEAAHIVPYLGEHTNIVTNGLLLRADIHTLFDLGLMKISSDYRISFDERLKDSEYAEYNGIRIRLPELEEEWPSIDAIGTRENL